jgi:predicted nucleic acid-binding protein
MRRPGADHVQMRLFNQADNRPFDDQASIAIQMETDAKLFIQEQIKQANIELAWSFILDYENNDNPFPEIRDKVAEWKKLASVDMDLTDEVAEKAEELMKTGLRQKDAAHVACAISSGADYFITTDRKICNKSIAGITIANPIDFARGYEHGD